MSTTVTVRFKPTRRTQRMLFDAIGQAMQDKGLGVSVEPVFPDDTDERWKGAFLVKFSGPYPYQEVVTALLAIPGVQSAHLAPARGPM